MTGKALGLSPLIVLIGLAFWSLLWGFVGMVLAVPLTVIFKIVLEHTPATRPLARMISEDAVNRVSHGLSRLLSRHGRRSVGRGHRHS